MIRKVLCFLFHYWKRYRIISVGQGQMTTAVFYCTRCKKYRTLASLPGEP